MSKRQRIEQKIANQIRKRHLQKLKGGHGKCMASSLHYGFIQQGTPKTLPVNKFPERSPRCAFV